VARLVIGKKKSVSNFYHSLGDAFIACVCTLLTIIGYLVLALSPYEAQESPSAHPSGWFMYLAAALQFNSIITVTIRFVKSNENFQLRSLK